MNFILTKEEAIFYECGYSNENSIFLYISGENYFFTDSRFSYEAKEGVKNSEIIIARDLIKEVVKVLLKKKVKKLIYDPIEFSSFYLNYIKSKTKIYLKPKKNFSLEKRIIKKESEIELIKKSANKNRELFKSFFDFIEKEGDGLSEKKLFFMAKYILEDFGKNSLSFPPIVAINQNSANPHAKPTDTKLKSKSLFLFDAGIKLNNYCSDRTRFFEFKNGRLTKNFTDNFTKKIYDIVYSANRYAIEKIKIGIKAKEVDKVAREYIEKKGFGKYFLHSLGHGIGLEIHELPIISSKSETILEEGMVFTIEPGIYLKNRFGIRFEDMVVLEKDGAKII